jgi:DNA-binding transcriptional LysR family regulator
MHYDLTDLQLFVLVTDAGSVTRGAERAHLATASASARLRRLEEALGVQLLERLPRGVQPTPAGEALLVHARAVLRELDSLHAQLGPFVRGVRGVVRVYANTNATNAFLPHDLGSFLASHPQIDVLMEEHSSAESLLAIREGAADIGVVAAAVQSEDLSFLPYRRDRLMLVLSPANPLASAAEIAFRDVLDEDFVSLQSDAAIHRFLEERAAEYGCRLRMRIQVRGFDAVCRMAGAGVGIGLVPESFARRAARIDPLAIVPLADAWSQRALKLCFRTQPAPNRYVRQLLDFLASQADAPFC